MNSAIFIGKPLYFSEHIKIYPPKLGDVLGNPLYGAFSLIFVNSQEDIWDRIAEEHGQDPIGTPIPDAPTPFEELLNNCYSSKEFMEIAKKAFLFFTGSQVRIIPERKIVLFYDSVNYAKEAKDLEVIDTDEKFFTFQNLIRQVLGDDPIEKPNLKMNKKVALIKAKGRLRERVKRKKGNVNGISFDAMLVALCCMGIGLSPLNIGEIPYPAIQPLFETYQRKEKYETDLKVATAGFGNSKVKPVYWIKNLK